MMSSNINLTLSKENLRLLERAVQDSSDVESLIDFFIQKAHIVDQSPKLLAQVVSTILDNDLSDSTLQKLKMVYEKTLCIEGNKKAHLKVVPSIHAFQLNPEDLKGETPLTFACKYSDLDVIKSLLKKSDPNELNQSGNTPIQIASLYNRADVVQLLLNSGVKDTTKAFLTACERGYVDIVRVLLSPENLSARTPLNLTPLMLACSENQGEVVQLLLSQKETNRDEKNSRGWTALQFACTSGCLKAVEALVCPENINMCDKFDYTPLSIACSNNHPTIALRLIQLGADVNLVNTREMSALDEACNAGCLEAVKALLTEDKLNVNDNVEEYTPLMFASEKNRVEVVRYLLERGADPEIANSDGMTALHLACQEGNLDIVKLVLTPNLLNAHNESEETPLMCACSFDHLEVAAYLMSQGADLDGVNEFCVEQLLPYLLKKFESLPKETNFMDRVYLLKPFFEYTPQVKELTAAKQRLIELYQQFNQPVKEAKTLIGLLNADLDEARMSALLAKAEKYLKAIPILLTILREVMEPDELIDMTDDLYRTVSLLKIRLEKIDPTLPSKLLSDFITAPIAQILMQWKAINLYPDCIDSSYALYDATIETGLDLVDKVGIQNQLEISYKLGANKLMMMKLLQMKIQSAEKMNWPTAFLTSALENLKQSDVSREIIEAERRFNVQVLRAHLRLLDQ